MDVGGGRSERAVHSMRGVRFRKDQGRQGPWGAGPARPGLGFCSHTLFSSCLTHVQDEAGVVWSAGGRSHFPKARRLAREKKGEVGEGRRCAGEGSRRENRFLK